MIENNFEKNRNEVAIIGLGLRLPGCSNDGVSFWNNLINKFNGITDATINHTRWSSNHVNSQDIKSKNAGLIDMNEIKNFDSLFFGIAPNEVGLIDPQQRLTLKATWEAFEDAGIDPFTIRGKNTSVFIGASTIDYQKNLHNDEDSNTNFFLSNFHALSNRISYCFDCRGQSLTIDTACSSSSNAIQLGYESIINGKSEYSIVGGTNLLLDPQFTKSGSYLNMLGKSGYCKVFDESADGYVRSEGVGIVILKNLQSAIRDGDNIYCVIKGANSNSDGTLNKLAFFSPSKDAQYENIIKALKNSDLEQPDIDYFECHGTGTPTGDPIETEGISMAFSSYHSKENPLLIGSVKSNIGHLEAGSGIASLIKCCLMFKHRKFVPNIHFNKPNPSIKFDEWNLKVVTEVMDFPSNKTVSMGINNFGITGSNVCIFLKECDNRQKYSSPVNERDTNINRNYLIPFSCNSKKSLEDYQIKILENFNQYSKTIDFKDFVSHHILNRSLNFSQRSVVNANSWDTFKDGIKNQIQTSNNRSNNMLHRNSSPELVFVFCGQGPQWNEMFSLLYQENQTFKDSVKKVNQILSKYAEFNILERLRSIDKNDKKSINNPLIAQTSLFILQISLFELYKSWGIVPSILVGHSFGELSSIYCSGLLSLEDACYLVYHRARLQSLTSSYNQDKSENSRMLVLNISEKQYLNQFSNRYPSIEICCFNSPESIVLGGNESHLTEIFNESKEKGIFSSFLGAPTAFHSSVQDQIKEEISSLKNIQVLNKNPSIKLFSTVTGKEMEISSNNLLNYIFENVRKPVLFKKAIKNIFKYIEFNNLGGKLLFLELSPHPTLSYYVKQMIPKDSNYFCQDSIQILQSLNKNKNDISEIYNTISQLYCNGYNVDFKCQLFIFHSPLIQSLNLSILKEKTNSLPRYQWDEKEYWIESERSIKLRTEGSTISQLGTKILSSENTFVAHLDINKESFQYLKGHQVKGKYYFPGCGYIDNIIKLFSKNDLNITYLEFKQPLILKEGKITSLKSEFIKTSKNEYKISFNFKDKQQQQQQQQHSSTVNDKDGWINTSNGKIQLFNNSLYELPERVNIGELKEKCNFTKLSKEEIYGHIKAKTGLNYLNHFKRVEECYHGNECSLSKVSVKPYLTDSFDCNDFFTNPSLLDTTFHGAISTFKESSLLVFDRIEDFKVYNSNIPKDINNHQYIWAYSENLYKKGDSYYSNLLVFLEDGTIIIEADKVVMTSLTPINDQLLINNPKDQLFSFYLQEKDSLINKLKLNEIIENLNHSNENKDLGSTLKSTSTSTTINQFLNQVLNPIRNEPAIFKILQFLSIKDQSSLLNDDDENLLMVKSTLENLNSTLNQLDTEIDLELTIALESEQLIHDLNIKLENNNNCKLINGSLLIKKINLNESLTKKQNLKLNDYDIVLLPIETNKSLLNQSNLIEIINSNGLLIHFNKENQLPEFKNNFKLKLNQETEITISEKYSIFSNDQSINNNNNNNINNNKYDQIIIITKNQVIEKEFINKLNNYYQNKNNLTIISTIKEFYSISSKLTNNSIIYYLKSLNQFNNDDILKYSMEYIKINQFLIKNNLMTKNLLISLNTQKESINFKNSILIGLRNYFEEEINLRIYSIDFDDESLSNQNSIKNIESLINNNYQQAEFIIRNNKAYYERLKKVQNFKSKFQSNSFIDTLSDEHLIAKLDPNLEYQLSPKPIELDPDFVEIETKAFGLNFKDSLIYRNLVPPELLNSNGDIHSPEFCFDFSGVITKVGSKVNEFKIGDPVFGISNSSSSTHIYQHRNQVVHKPDNLSHVEASTIPIVYSTSLYCLFYLGQLNIEEEESVLIHAGTGGVGLSAIELLKWKGFKGHLFVTVGSKEKEQYLINKYGSFITGIYSTRNVSFVREIKKKLKELGSNQTGVDLILNSLSNDYLESNFKCLSKCGRIVDISITHLTPNEYTDFHKFKYNIGYHVVELTKLPNTIIKKLLKEISIGFSENQLNLTPIKEYEIQQLKEAFEFMNKRELIGKISIKMNRQSIFNSLCNGNQNEFTILKPNYKINDSSFGKTILVTGQSGLILEIMKWIVKFTNGEIENIIVLSKSKLRWELEKLIKESKLKTNINFIYRSLDISDYGQLKNTIYEIYNENSNLSPIETIIHFAFQRVEHEILEIDEPDMKESIAAKVYGAINLHNLSMENKLPLKQFIMSSSIVSIFGRSILAGYVSGNFVLDALARHRKSLGLPAITINFGVFESAGFVSNYKQMATLLEGIGFSPITVNTLLGSLDLFVQNQDKSNRFMVNNFNESLDFSNRPVGNKVEFMFNQIKGKKKLLTNEETNINQTILQKISDLLSIEVSKINSDNKLLDYGADSLIMVQLKNYIDQNFVSNCFTISQLQSQTINLIIKNIIIQMNNKSNSNNNTSSQTNKINKLKFWENEIKLDPSIKPTPNSDSYELLKQLLKDRSKQLNILLTGTTGYLGVYMLNGLLKLENCSKIYCIVRNKKTENDALNSIIDNLNSNKLENTMEELNKIQVLCGDLTQDLFGLKQDQYNQLSKNINFIISCASYTNIEAHYSECKDINVFPTKQFIKLSCNERDQIKPIVYISSFSIFKGIEKDEYENTLIPTLEECEENGVGYCQSKIVSEYLMREASQRGIPSLIYRLPFLFANSNTGLGNAGDFMQLFLQSCVALKYYPFDYTQSMNAIPIDWVSDNILKLSLNYDCWYNKETKENHVTYNLFGNSKRYVDCLLPIIDEYQLKPITLKEWMVELNNSDHYSCKRQKEFHSNVMMMKKTIFPPTLKTPDNLIKLLESLGTNYEESFLSGQILKNHLKLYFK